jgi:hypothetical protein
MLRVLTIHLLRSIDLERAPYVLIGAGVVYLVAFNTVLRDVDILYFDFLVLVAAVGVLFVVRGPERRRLLRFVVAWAADRVVKLSPDR